jgi:hypothetical protein
MCPKLVAISLLNALISTLTANGHYQELPRLLELRHPDNQSGLLRSVLPRNTSRACRNRNEE